MTILLHIGSHKTGTTAIQHFLARNRDALRSQGVWYPSEAELLPDGSNSIRHLNIARSLDSNGKPKPYSADELKMIAAMLTRKSQDFETTIISAEAFWRIGFGGDALSGETSRLWQRKQENIARIRSLLGDADVRVVAVLRERVSYIQKSYSEYVLCTTYHKRIKKFIRQFSHSADYRRQLEAWRQHFPVQVLSYEHLCRHQNLPRDFTITLAGPISLPREQEDCPQHFNVGHAIPCVLFKRYLNRINSISREERQRLYNKASRKFNRAGHSRIVSRLHSINSWMTAKEIRRLRRSYLDDDALIREQYCPHFISGPSSKEAMAEETVVPLKRKAALMTLGWMLSKRQPAPSWFDWSSP